jgi:hypothetical protein
MKKIVLFVLIITSTNSIASSKWAILINVCRHNGGFFGYKNITQVWDLNSLNNNNGIAIVNLDCEEPGINPCRLKKPLFGGNMSSSPDEFGNTPNDILDKIYDTINEIQVHIDKGIIDKLFKGEDIIKIDYKTTAGIGGLIVIEYAWNGDLVNDVPNYCAKFKIYFSKMP